MAGGKRYRRVQPRSKVIARKVTKTEKSGEKVLFVEVVAAEKEANIQSGAYSSPFLTIHPDSLIALNEGVKYQIVPRRGSVLVSSDKVLSGRELESIVSGKNKPSDSIQKVTERLGMAMRAAHADLESVDIGNLVRTMMRVVPNKNNELADRVGPFYDTLGLTTWLDKSRQAIDKQVHSGKLLACMTSDRMRLYPVWQFTEDGELIPGLREVLAVLHSGTHDGWTKAVWLLTPTDELDGSALDWLKARHDIAPVIDLAREDAAAWAA